MPSPARGTVAHAKWRAKISRSQKKRIREQGGVWNKGHCGVRQHSANTRAKMSLSHRKMWHNRSPGDRQIHAQRTSAGLRRAIKEGRFTGMLGKSHSPSTIVKQRASNSTPEVLAKHSRDYRKYSARQTKPELLLQTLLDGRRWKFVGAPVLNDGNANPNWKLCDLPISADFVNRKMRTLLMMDGWMLLALLLKMLPRARKFGRREKEEKS